MKRLTEYEIIAGHAHAVPTYNMDKAMMSLAAYEDTGLEPQQVMELKSFTQGGIHKVDDGWKHVQELLQAEQDGRLVVLPCKVGETVFDIGDGTAYATRVLNFSYLGDHWACCTVSSYPDLEQFGTRIFLTREEAEAALEKKEGKDHA